MSLERLGQQLARELDAIRARTTDRAAVREALEASPPRIGARRWPRVAKAALAGALAAAAAAGLWLARPWSQPHGVPARSPLIATLERSQRPVAAGAFVEAPAHEGLAVRFSDGSRLQLNGGARARLVELDAAGAHVLLEEGLAHVEVEPNAHARYRISAGPFGVRVTGTRFDVRWDPEQDQFDLDLTRGHVEVSGCVFGRGYGMRAGQRVHASCKRGEFDVTERGAERAVVPPAAAVTARAEDHARTGRERERARRTDWQVLAQQGKYAQALAGGDFEQRCAQATGEQLVLLADAAHYAGEHDQEGYALRLLRQRFAGTARGALAAFALGRLEFDVYGEYRKAAEWFGTYLKEQPAGPLVREARGRLIEATAKAGDARRARELAQAYLHEYPDGPHAELARSLLEAASH
jgi:ferric-dicitrate binding protein FerR (iron transport regulator)